MLKTFFLSLMVSFFAMGLNACGQTSDAFQKDADIIRLNHLEYYGGLLNLYHTKTKTYPFMGKVDVPLYSFVASPEQIDDINGGPPYAHKVVGFSELIIELERVLDRSIDEYYDPQYAPDAKPNFYIYMVDGDIYNFAIHTSQPYSFSNPVARGYNKVEITNNTNGSPHLITSHDLFSSAEFKHAKTQNIAKLGFFQEREKKFLSATKVKN